jgi:predicted transcriptional regulator
MVRRKITIYIDEDLLLRVKEVAARSRKKDYEVLEDALRSHLAMDVFDEARRQSRLSEDKALELAYEAVRNLRRPTSS